METHNVSPFSRRNFRIFGTGLLTYVLAPALQKNKNWYLAGTITGTNERAETGKKKYNILNKNISNYNTFDQIANNDDIDVICVDERHSY